MVTICCHGNVDVVMVLSSIRLLPLQCHLSVNLFLWLWICPTLRFTTPQWNLSIKETECKGHLSNEDTVCCPNHIFYKELCTNLPLNQGHLSIQDSQLGPNGVLYREVPLYTGQPAGSQELNNHCWLSNLCVVQITIFLPITISTICGCNIYSQNILYVTLHYIVNLL